MTTFGYARCSSDTQSYEIQISALKAAGCDVVRAEKVSGKTRDGRNELATILDFLREGDKVTVTRLDRLGRSTRDVLNIIHEIETKGASIRVLDPLIDTDGPMGKVILTVLGMVSEMELNFIRARQRAGIDAAKKAGVYKGRPVSLDHAKVMELRNGGLGVTEITKVLGCSRGAIYKIISASKTALAA